MLNGMIEVSDLGCPRQFAVEVAPVIACAIGNSHDLQLWARGYNGRKFVTEHPLDGCLLRFRHSSHADRVQRCALVIVDRHGGAGRLAIAGGSGIRPPPPRPVSPCAGRPSSMRQRHRHYGPPAGLPRSARIRHGRALTQLLRQAVERATRRHPTKTCSASPGTRCAVTHAPAGRARRPVPTNQGAACSAPAAAVRRRHSTRRGRGTAEVRYSHSLRRGALPHRHGRRCVREASQLLRGRARSTAESFSNSDVRRQRVEGFLDEGDQLLQRICGRARQLVRVFGASLLLVGSAVPRLASRRSLPPRRYHRDPLPRTYPASGGMVARRPLATHGLPATECHMADSDEP